MSNQAANRATTVRCVVREVFSSRTPTNKKALQFGGPFILMEIRTPFYFVTPLFWFRLRLSESIFGTSVAPSSALK